MVFKKDEYILAYIAHNIAIVQSVKDLSRILICSGEIVQGFLHFFLSDQVHTYQLLLQHIRILLGKLRHECLDGIQSSILSFVKFWEIHCLNTPIGGGFHNLIIENVTDNVENLEWGLDSQEGLGEWLQVEELVLEVTCEERWFGSTFSCLIDIKVDG